MQTGFAFPASLTEEYKPQSIDGFVGLAKHKRMLCKLSENPMSRPALLFLGAPGTGKTSLAFAYAKAIGAEVHHVPSQEATIENVKRVSDSCHYVPFSGGFHVVLVDEADKMTPAVQLYLLSKLDGTQPCPNTIWIFTCNSTETLQERFTSRCLALPTFNTYGAGDEIKSLLARIWRDKAGDVPVPDLTRVPTGNVRESLQWLDAELLAA